MEDEIFSPPLMIVPIEYNSKQFYIIRDDLLIGGSKQRGLVPLIKNSTSKCFVYASPNNGYAQIALAYACKLCDKKCVIFVNDVSHPFTDLAHNLGATIKYIKNGFLKKIQKSATRYATLNNCELIPFGVDTQYFVDYMVESITLAKPDNFNPKKIWLVAGSATLLKVLYKVFPETHFCVVQVGKTIWDDQLELGRTTLYIAPEKFIDDANHPPPYPTVSSYDAKLWQFARNGDDGDYIWNVATDLS